VKNVRNRTIVHLVTLCWKSGVVVGQVVRFKNKRLAATLWHGALVVGSHELPKRPPVVTKRNKIAASVDRVSERNVAFLRATARSAKRVLAIVILSVCLSVCLSRPGTESSPGEIETPGFYRMIA